VPPSPNSARSPTKSNGGSRPPRRRPGRAAKRAKQRHALARRHGVAQKLPPQVRKGPAPRNPGAHPAARPPLGQSADPAHGQRRRLRRVPKAPHRRPIPRSRRPPRVPKAPQRRPLPRSRRPPRVPKPPQRRPIAQSRRRGDLKPQTSGSLGPSDKADEDELTKSRPRGDGPRGRARHLAARCREPSARRTPRSTVAALSSSRTGRSLSGPWLSVLTDVGAGESHPALHHHRPSLLPLRRADAAAPRFAKSQCRISSFSTATPAPGWTPPSAGERQSARLLARSAPRGPFEETAGRDCLCPV
jgi:hypothetical protein